MYYTVCGKEINDDAVICTGCGCMVKGKNVSNNEQKQKPENQASVFLGIAGIIFAWLFALIGHITSVIGIVLGIKEYKENEKITGLTLSIIGEVCSIFLLLSERLPFQASFDANIDIVLNN